MTGPAVQEDGSGKLQSLQQGIQRLKRDIENKAQRTLEEGRSVRRKVTLTPSRRAASPSKSSAGLGPKAARSVDKELEGIAEARPARVGDPWDFLIRPEDDLRDSAARMRLQTLMRAAAIVHFGIDCKTFTRARGIPVKGAKWWPKAVRSDEWPLGLPSLGALKSSVLKTKVLEANAMADNVA